MLITKVHRRYAKSLLEFAQETGKLEEVKLDVDRVVDAMAGSREFRLMLKSPVINNGKKEKIIDAVFYGQLTEITAQFIKILIRKGREDAMEETMKAFIDLYNIAKGIEKAVITTAEPLSDAQRESIKSKLAAVTRHDIEIEEKVDPAIIGGLKVKVGDRQYNGSIATQLNQLRRQFKKNVFVADY